MWDKLREICFKPAIHATFAGKVWYLLIIVFRIIVVSTVGTAVYSDEQSEFRCSTEVIGCNNVCFDKFSKISHIRFWAFQLLAVISPAVLFHFYAVQTSEEDSKTKSGNAAKTDKATMRSERNADRNETPASPEISLMRSGRSDAHSEDKNSPEKKKDAITAKQRHFYIFSVILRVVIEAGSLYFACVLFRFADETVTDSHEPFGFIFIKIPQVYICMGENVERACGQHMRLGERTGYVPCWISRPWEKTIFMAYMNTLSMTCLILSFIEFVQLIYRHYYNKPPKIKEQASMMETELAEEASETEYGYSRRKDHNPMYSGHRGAHNVEYISVPHRVRDTEDRNSGRASDDCDDCSRFDDSSRSQ